MRADLQQEFAVWHARLLGLSRPARRRLQRQWKQSLAAIALLLALGQAPALAATINVGGGCSLVNAITAANADIAAGGCAAGSGADTIVLPANSTRTLATVNNPTYAGNGLPVIASTITIVGNGSTIIRSQAADTPEFRLFLVDDTGTLSLNGLTLTNGATRYGGAAVATRAGSVTLTNCTITGNTAATSGGALRVFYGGTLTLRSSTVSGNTAAKRGGAIYTRGTTTLTNSTISGNSAGFDAGGVYNFRGSLSITNSTIAGNTAPVNAGGVWNIGGRVALTNSTISGNSAGNNGGGLSNAHGIMSLINSTVVGNAGGRGGGVFSGGSFNNVRSDVVLFRSLISGNASGHGAELYQETGGVTSANHYNLFGHSGLTNAQATGGGGLVLAGPSDFAATSDGGTPTALASILDPTLANHGGLTQTHALVAGSPAIDAAGTGCPPPNTDQRGVPRQQDGTGDNFAFCDIGAFEVVRAGAVICDRIPADIIGTPAAETLIGTNGHDVIQGLGGNDLIRGLAGNDLLCGGAGNDRVLGGAGSDRLLGGGNTDRVNGEIGFDRCNGGAGSTDATANCEVRAAIP